MTLDRGPKSRGDRPGDPSGCIHLRGLRLFRRKLSAGVVFRLKPEATRTRPDEVAIYRIHGPFLFGSTDKLDDLARDIPALPPIVVLRLRNMTAIDGTGLHAFERFADALRASGRTLPLCGMRDQPARMMARAAFHRHIGAENILPSLEAALARARVLVTAGRDPIRANAGVRS